MTYNKKIRILKSTDVQDEVGNTDCVWNEVFCGWASVNCTGGRRYYEAAQTNQQNDNTYYSNTFKNVTYVSFFHPFYFFG